MAGGSRKNSTASRGARSTGSAATAATLADTRGLKASVRIGGISTRLNYSDKEKAFHRDSVPAPSRDARRDTLMWKRRGRLGSSNFTKNIVFGLGLRFFVDISTF